MQNGNKIKYNDNRWISEIKNTQQNLDRKIDREGEREKDGGRDREKRKG
jgi:hypothetical protein